MTCEHLNELIMRELGEAELDDDVIVVGDVMCDECEREYYVVLTIDGRPYSAHRNEKSKLTTLSEEGRLEYRKNN